jgi:hypothetical protein
MFEKQHCVGVVFANTSTLAFTALDGKKPEEGGLEPKGCRDRRVFE